MKTNEKTITKKLTLEEIEALPFASVIWHADEDNNNGVIWHGKMPVVIGVPGKYGILIGGNDASVFERDIDDHLLDDPGSSYWDHEPDQSQLRGITEEEYNAMPNEEEIVFPRLAEAITSRKITFDRLCKQMGMDFKSFWDAMTGKRNFYVGELASIATALDTTVDEIFFPEAVPDQI